jgi:propanol-preferring alcohol dehydrogenase
MKALFMTKIAPIEKHPLRYGNFDDPVVDPNTVLVKVSACGVCHSQLHLIEGDFRMFGIPAFLPIVPGHEIAGVVESVGHDVKNVRPGQRVGVSVIWSACGKCEFCLAGCDNLCLERKTTGEMVNGGYAEYLKVPYNFVYPIPDNLKAEDAASLFCAGITGYRSIERTGIKPDDYVMIFGIGGVGHFSLQFAKLKGAKVVAVDVSKAARRLARELGADEAIPPSEVEKYTKVNKPSKVVVHTPAPAAIDLATKVVKFHGTLMMAVVGDVPLVFNGEVTVATSMVGSQADIREVVRLASEGKVRVKATPYPLNSGTEILKKLKDGQIVGRAVLVP